LSILDPGNLDSEKKIENLLDIYVVAQSNADALNKAKQAWDNLNFAEAPKVASIPDFMSYCGYKIPTLNAFVYVENSKKVVIDTKNIKLTDPNFFSRYSQIVIQYDTKKGDFFLTMLPFGPQSHLHDITFFSGPAKNVTLSIKDNFAVIGAPNWLIDISNSVPQKCIDAILPGNYISFSGIFDIHTEKMNNFDCQVVRVSPYIPDSNVKVRHP
jgi:hypothetical protein